VQYLFFLSKRDETDSGGMGKATAGNANPN